MSPTLTSRPKKSRSVRGPASMASCDKGRQRWTGEHSKDEVQYLSRNRCAPRGARGAGARECRAPSADPSSWRHSGTDGGERSSYCSAAPLQHEHAGANRKAVYSCRRCGGEEEFFVAGAAERTRRSAARQRYFDIVVSACIEARQVFYPNRESFGFRRGCSTPQI